MLCTTAPDRPAPTPALPLLAAADLQDNLMTATHDLERLQALLSEACDTLMSGFHGAFERLRSHGEEVAGSEAPPALYTELSRDLRSAITALQFQDMASQLIAHTGKRLRNCADRLAYETMGDDGDGAGLIEDAPLRPNPVTQDEMDAGSIELF